MILLWSQLWQLWLPGIKERGGTGGRQVRLQKGPRLWTRGEGREWRVERIALTCVRGRGDSGQPVGSRCTAQGAQFDSLG